jgi:flagellar hook-length control protein FliK
MHIFYRYRIYTYNWQEISSVLTALLAGIQQLQDTKMAVPNVEQSLPVDSKNPSVVSNLRDLLTTDNQIENQPFSSELVSKLGNLFMVGTGSENQPISSKLVSSGTSISKPAELILKLEKLLGKVHLQAVGQSDFELTHHTNNDLGSSVDSEINQTDIQQYGVNKPYLQSALPSQDLNPTDQGLMAGKQVQQTSFDLSNEIISKIQTILSYINPAGSENSNLKQPTDTNNVVNSQTNNLSLDKNQLLLSYIPKQGNNNVSKVPILPLKKSTLPPDDFIAKLQHLLQKPNGIMETKLQIEQPAEVSVSGIVPEVAEWIGKSIGNLDGQFKSAETKFSLFPEHLGHIEVKITSLQGQITAQIVTDTSSAKEALEGQLQHLKQAIQQHGIVVQKLDIVQQLPSTAESSLGNLSFSQGGSGSGEQRALYFDRESGKKQTNQDSIEMENESLPASYGGMLKPSSTIDFSA